MSRDHHYAVALNWTGAAHGSTIDIQNYSREFSIAIDGKAAFVGSADPMFRGDPALYNPEELLVTALVSCHMLSFLAIAARAGLVVMEYRDASVGTMLLEAGSGHFVSVALHPHVVVAVGSDPALIHSLQAQAHQACFIARSVNFPVTHEVTIETREIGP